MGPRGKSRSTWWLILLILPLAGSLAWHLAGPEPREAGAGTEHRSTREAPDRTTGRQSEHPEAPTPAPSVLREARCRFQTGDRLSFQLSTHSRVLLDASALLTGTEHAPPHPGTGHASSHPGTGHASSHPGTGHASSHPGTGHASGPAASLSPTTETKEIRGLLLGRVLSEEASPDRTTWIIQAALTDLEASVNNQALPEALVAQLTEPVLWELDDLCRFRRLGTNPGHSPAAQRQWQLWLGLMDFGLPEQKNAESWTLDQADATGDYRANYRRTPGDQGILREKAAYTRTNSPGNNIPVSVVIRHAHASATPSTGRDGPLADRWFEGLEVDEQLEVRTRDQGLFAGVETRFSLSRVETDPAADLRITPLQPAAAQWLSLQDLAPDRGAQLRFAGLPLEPGLEAMNSREVAARFQELLAGDRKKEEALRLMVQYLRLDPAHLTELLDLVREGAFSPAAQPFAFLALQLTGGKAAAEALSATAKDTSFPLSAQLQAVSALKDVPEPDREVVAAIKALCPDQADPNDQRANTALLAAGSLVSREDLDPGLREDLSLMLREKLTRADSPEELGHAMAAMANTRDPGMADLLTGYLDDPAPSVRVDALAALRGTGAVLSPSEALDRLARDPDPRCTRELSRHLAAGSEQAAEPEVQSAARLLQVTTDPLVRAGLIEFLGALAATSDLAMQALITAFAVETNPALLTLIGRFVPADRLP